MEISTSTLLQSEIILKDIGFKRLFRWKIDKKNFLIQICPYYKHIVITTPDTIRRLYMYESICKECCNEYPKDLEKNLKCIYPYEHLMFKLFQILDQGHFTSTYLWKEINSNLLAQTLFAKYLETKHKHFKDISNISDSSKINLSESFDCFDISHLMKTNLNYVNIIIKLQQENTKYQDQIKLFDEIIDEQNDIISHFTHFLNDNHDIYTKFRSTLNIDDDIDTNLNTYTKNPVLRLVNNGEIINK